MNGHLACLLTSVALIAGHLAEPAVARQGKAGTERTRFDPGRSDPQAILLVENLWETLGGRRAYAAIEYLQFAIRYDVGDVTRTSRGHLWDRRENRVRFNMQTRRGDLVVQFDLRSQAGVALENREPIPAADLAGVVQRARDWFGDDAHLMVMPWRLEDPGVELALGEDEVRGERVLKRLVVRSNGADWLGPGDRYEVLIDVKSGYPVEWEFHYARRPEETEDPQPVTFVVGGWLEKNGVRFPTRFQEVGADRAIRIVELETPPVIEDSQFAALSSS